METNRKMEQNKRESPRWRGRCVKDQGVAFLRYVRTLTPTTTAAPVTAIV
jgi:hypothetical protein